LEKISVDCLKKKFELNSFAVSFCPTVFFLSTNEGMDSVISVCYRLFFTLLGLEYSTIVKYF
jgi:hypothetical protein